MLFYCHFPDLLLVQRRSFLRAIYRWPLNAAEELTTGQADKLLVNSQFTQGRLLKHCCSFTLSRVSLALCLTASSRPLHGSAVSSLHLHTPHRQ